MSHDIYKGPMVNVGPDMVVGYARGYRGGGGSGLGEFRKDIVEDNTDAWCGDHCVAAHLAPGVFFCNRSVAISDPTLVDIAPTILHAFGLTPAGHMQGRNLFDGPVALAGR